MEDLQAGLPPVAAMVRYGSLALRRRMEGTVCPQGIVVGCGSGDEVLFIERALRCNRVVGVDIEPRFSPLARRSGRLLLGDAESLPFAAAAFDFAVALHSLEHVHDSRRAMEEVARVLRPGGWFYMGVPSSTRLVGYLGSFDMNTWQKIRGNLRAWGAQLTGRFRNELGAHAGFERRQLARLLAERFAAVEFITEDYLRFKYAGRVPRPLLDLLLARPLSAFTVSSHYAICRKPV